MEGVGATRFRVDGLPPHLGPWNVGVVEAGNPFSPNFVVYRSIAELLGVARESQ